MIVVLGGSSFIGAYTVETLAKNGIDVIATGRNDRLKAHFENMGVKYITVDITNKEDFNKLPQRGVDGVILLAALLPANAHADLVNEENAADYFEVNTVGTINALEYCRRNGIERLLSTTSYADVSNYWDKNFIITEDTPRGFQFKGDHSVYVISKNAASDVMEYYNQQYNMKNAIFRLPPVYGVGPHGSLLINGKKVKSGLQIFIDKALKGEDIEVYGDKEVARDVVYVKDVASALMQGIGSKRTYGLYNIGSGRATTLEEQAKVVAEVFGSSKQKSHVVFKPEIENKSFSYNLDISKAKIDFNYSPKFDDFKKMMIDWKYELERGVYSNLFI